MSSVLSEITCVMTLVFVVLSHFHYCQCCTSDSGSLYTMKKLKTIGNVEGLCTVMKLPDLFTRSHECLKICRSDKKCKFYQHYNDHCYICSEDEHYLDGSAEVIPAANYTREHAKNYVFLKLNVTGRREIKDCFSLKNEGSCSPESGVYRVKQSNGEFKQVYCDMEEQGGGWTVIQRVVDGSVSFERDWVDYEEGFGNLAGTFWLGNRYVAELTSQTNYELRVDIAGNNVNDTAYDEYSSFSLNASDRYRLNVSGHSGTAGNGLLSGSAGGQRHNGMRFSTRDQDNDNHGGVHCARDDGGWWYHGCSTTNLNRMQGAQHNILWGTAQFDSSIEYAQMKIRPRA